MRNLLIVAIGLGLLWPNALHAQAKACVQSDQLPVAHSGQMLQAMVELWWHKQRLPMRIVPDQVTLKHLAKGGFRIEFLRQGCPILAFAAPEQMLRRFLNKRLGPEI